MPRFTPQAATSAATSVQRRRWTLVALVVVTAARVLVSWWQGNTYLEAPFDDALMVQYANLSDHFANPNWLSLVKTMSYAAFLQLPGVTGLSYNVCVSLLWVLAALSVGQAVWRGCNVALAARACAAGVAEKGREAGGVAAGVAEKGREAGGVASSGVAVGITAAGVTGWAGPLWWAGPLAYVFVLWTPIAFDGETAVRIYRNALITPTVFLIFGLMLQLVVDVLVRAQAAQAVATAQAAATTRAAQAAATLATPTQTLPTRTLFAHGIVLALAFTFTYYLKEDGAWLLATLAAFSVVLMVVALVLLHCAPHAVKQLLQLALCLALPFALWGGVTVAYTSVNQRYFGVSETNTRTQGELGTFVSNVYRIASPNKNAWVWAPEDAIRAAWAASPTLSLYPGVLERLLENPWFVSESGDNTIYGDFLGWTLRWALLDEGLWTSEQDVNNLFAQVNQELEAAFDAGTLQEDSRIFLTSGSGSRSGGEVASLADDVVWMYATNLLLLGYSPQPFSETTAEATETALAASYLLNQYVSEPTAAGITAITGRLHTVANALVQVEFWLYRLSNVLLVLAGIAAAVATPITLTRRHAWRCNPVAVTFWLFGLGVVAVSLLYAVGITWFSEFIYQSDFTLMLKELRFYGCGIIAIVVTALMSWCLAWAAVAKENVWR